MARVLARFYDATGGTVRVDGHDVRDLTLTSLRANIGVVLDEPFLFSVSIRDNIAYGRPDASMEEVRAAAEAAGAAGFIDRLADGYDTVVGERGYTLSGGQRQRIAIARALLVNPPILILDDATSAIDVKVEQRIHSALRVLMEGRTTLIIAHRLSTISLADRVVLLDGGRIVADGTHAELLATTPLYSEVLAQAASDEAAASRGRGRSRGPRPGRRRVEPEGVALAPEDGLSRPTTMSSSPRGVRSDVRWRRSRAAHGRRRAPGSAQAGLPFGGIPHELQAGVDLLLKEEPERGESDAVFTQLPTEHETKKLSLTSLLMEYPGMCALAALLVGSSPCHPARPEPGLLRHQPRPDPAPLRLRRRRAHGGALPGVDRVSAGAQWGQARVTGRLASWVMNDLRIKVFRHLQRLSLDFFTEEKAGVVMSRMTSDIENLQQLLQDGLAQFAIQGLTMVVITVLLFATNAKLAAITVFAVLPPLIIMSIWFQRASERGYDKVRDGIALVLADLSESLQGVRIVTAHNRQRYNVETHRDVVGSYRDANNYTGRINGIYGPGSQVISVFGQLLILGIGGSMYLHHPRRSTWAS